MKLKKIKKKNIILIAIGFFLIIIFYMFLYVNSALNNEIPTTNEIFVTVPKNADVEQVVKIFGNVGILEPQWLFNVVIKVYAKMSDKKIVAGCYRIPPGITNLDIIKAVYSGNQLFTITVTYPEGINLRDFASISARKIGIDSAEFVRLAQSDSFIKAFDIDAETAEGYLMPSTYEFNWKQSVVDVLERLVAQQNKIWNDRFAAIAKETHKTRHEILTLASIIEAETPIADEKSRIAGVYYNRIRKNWKLESDPTVQYALGYHKQRLFFKDLEFDSPYNTYKYPGLPPGPINSPSLSSIEAALRPEKNDFMYFVAKGDGSRRHNFSETAAKHQRYVAEFRKNRK